jgi:hypothetical protein
MSDPVLSRSVRVRMITGRQHAPPKIETPPRRLQHSLPIHSIILGIGHCIHPEPIVTLCPGSCLTRASACASFALSTTRGPVSPATILALYRQTTPHARLSQLIFRMEGSRSRFAARLLHNRGPLRLSSRKSLSWVKHCSASNAGLLRYRPTHLSSIERILHI